jgi:hypothetical protein
MSMPLGLVCLLIKSGQVKQSGVMDQVSGFAQSAAKNMKVPDMRPTPGFNYNASLPGSPVGGGLTGGLIGAGIGALGSGAYNYFTAPDEIDPETGQQKSKWSAVWPGMGRGALLGGAAGTVAGIHGAHNENLRFFETLKKINPLEAAKFQMYHQPDNIPKMLYGEGGLSDIGKNEA